MGRLTSCWDSSATLVRFSTLLLLTTTVHTATAAKVIFPDAEPCTLNNGETGRCLPILDCPPVLQTFKEQPPVQCGFEGFTQIVCCPKGQGNPTDPSQDLLDISTPLNYNELNCGITAVQQIPFGGFPFDPLVRASRSLPKPLEGKFEKRPAGPDPITAVVGGVPSRRDAWPWMALLGRKTGDEFTWFCAGALINEEWVLSAAHCFRDITPDVIRLAEHDHSTTRDGAKHEDFTMAELVRYPEYRPPQAYHDLALLKLHRRVKLQEFIRPVCLPWGRMSEDNIVGNTATIVGWGTTAFGGFSSSVLREANVQVFPSSTCNNTYSTLFDFPTSWPRGIGEENICAGVVGGGKDTCQGDSGGPLVTRILGLDNRFVAGGVVSRGFGCGHEDFPGLYGNLRYPPYLAWIKKTAF